MKKEEKDTENTRHIGQRRGNSHGKRERKKRNRERGRGFWYSIELELNCVKWVDMREKEIELGHWLTRSHTKVA